VIHGPSQRPRYVLFQEKGQGGGAFGKTKTLLVAGLFEEGQEPGQLNDLQGKVVNYLENSGY